MRDITLGDTFYHFFTTRAFSTGVPTTLAGSPVLSVLEENNATPITSGVSVQVDRASVTGLNQATIVATSGNGFEAGKSYAIYISTGTVDSVSVVGEVVGEFTIQASAAFTRLGAPAGASVSADIATIDSNVDAILVDTGTTLDTHLSDIKGTGFVKDTHSLTNIEGYADLIDDGTSGLAKIATDVAAILVDTAEIGAAGAGLTAINLPDQTMNITGNITGNLSGSVGSVTGAVGSVTDASGIFTAVVTTQLTEAYATAGVAPTVAQALLLIQQSLHEFAISGTTRTVKKLDGSTTAATFTFDDATTPTSTTRAT